MKTIMELADDYANAARFYEDLEHGHLILKCYTDLQSAVSALEAKANQVQGEAVECTCKASEMPFGRCCKASSTVKESLTVAEPLTFPTILDEVGARR